jgi:dephospho-CoA kinase
VNTGRSRSRSRVSEKGPPRDFLVVGVTGGIGSGKSAVCREFARLGRTVISADAISRDLAESDPEVRGRIAAEFGRSMFTSAGVLDRRALADVVFRDRRSLALLNGIIHPAVFRRLDETLAALPPEARKPYVIEEAALIYESGRDRSLDYVIVVDAPEETRIARIMARDGVSREDIVMRMQSQMPPHEKLRKADFTLENSGPESGIREKVTFFDRILGALAP